MYGDLAREYLDAGITAAKSGQRADARRWLLRVAEAQPDLVDQIRAWRYLVDLAETPAERRSWLERILVVDPTDGAARRELAVMTGQLPASAIVEPGHLTSTPVPASAGTATVPVSCVRCGAALMMADPFASTLVCQHCGHREPLPSADATASGGGDVTGTLWTGRGRTVPEPHPMRTCQQCGAAFLVTSALLSASCPYCGAVLMPDTTTTADVLTPDSLVPFAVDHDAALVALETHGADCADARLRGVYLPAWRFTFSGTIEWTDVRVDADEGSDPTRAFTRGSRTMLETPACVPATSRVPSQFDAGMHEAFDWLALTPYAPAMVASWLVEPFTVSLDAAAAAAQHQATARMRADVANEVGHVTMRVAQVIGERYQLVLVPMWVAHAGPSGTDTPLYVNGQSGDVYQVDSPSLWTWVRRLL